MRHRYPGTNSNEIPYNPRWSPDGSWIAYMLAWQIWVVRADGTDNRVVGDYKANYPS